MPTQDNTSPTIEIATTPWLSEDWTAIYVGMGILLVALFSAFRSQPSDIDWPAAEAKAEQIRLEESSLSVEDEAKLSATERKALSKQRSESMLKKIGIRWEPWPKQFLLKIGKWEQNPSDALRKRDKQDKVEGPMLWQPLLWTAVVLAIIGLAITFFRGGRLGKYLLAFPGLFALAAASYWMAEQSVIKYYNLEYALWALLMGMLICNTVGTPRWLAPAVQGELLIKTGLVLLGAEVLFAQLLALGIPGVFVAWLVTPTVLVTSYLFGQYILKLPSRTLNIVISADMSVCGVSAAIATAAACKAKKEELSLAIGLSLCFTAAMMVIMPPVIIALGLDPVVGGAWIGGTIDSTGAVAAAGAALGIRGFETAVTVKMIQNILIGVIALCVAIYWSRWVEPTLSSNDHPSEDAVIEGARKSGDELSRSRPEGIGLSEIWKRFPKFVLGFILASLFFSFLFGQSFWGASLVQATTKDYTVLLRGWLFCMAFVSIGLSTNFRELAPYLMTGKPVVLYLCGQALNLLLTLAMAYLMFGVLFKGSI